MAYRFDYLVAPLRCPGCGVIASADETLEMTTRLRDEPELAYLGVGDPLPVDADDALNSGYLLVRAPVPGEPVVLLHTWRCVACSTWPQWAKVTVSDGIIQAIEPVDLDRAALDLANFIVEDAREVAAALAGIPSSLEVDDSLTISILRGEPQAPG